MRLAQLASAVAAAALLAGGAAATQTLDFSPAEFKRILQHGPWPMPWKPDPSNRVSGRHDAAAFGERLFFDPRLSTGGKVSCATCHLPEKNFTDGRQRGVGLDEVDRNTPTIVDVRYHRWFGWDGGNDNLWAQSLRPLLDVRELATSEGRVAAAMRSEPDFNCAYRRVFGDPARAPDDTVFVNVGKALAAYQETLVSARTPFDDFRDALARGDRKAMRRYPLDAQRGLRIFVGKGSCSVCHFGPAFTNGEFHEIGISVLGRRNFIDWGRYQGIKMLRSTRFNLEGPYNDDPRRSTALSTQHVTLGAINYEQFKVPSLRGVALTAPYMHNGMLETLEAVVNHYSNFDPALMHQVHQFDEEGLPMILPPDTLLKPLHLTTGEISDLVAFLKSLTPQQRATGLPRGIRRSACR